MKKVLLAALGGVVVAGMPMAARAVSLGQVLQGYTGEISIHITGASTGSIYDRLGADTGIGFGAGSEAAAITAMNGIALTSPKSGLAGEDSWGIFRIDSIFGDTDNNGSIDNLLWSNGDLGVELAGVYFGLTDVAVDNNTVARTQTIYANGFNVAIYKDETPIAPYAVGSPASRIGASGYAGISDGAGEGVPVWTIVGSKTFNLDDGKAFPGDDAEFQVEIQYNAAGGITKLQGSLEGLFATNSAGQTGTWNSQMVPSPVAINYSKEVAGVISFDPDPTHFDLRFKDPIAATVAAIPTPSALFGGMGLGGLLLVGAARRRRSRE